MKIQHFDADFGQLVGGVGGGVGGSASVIASEIVQNFLTTLQAGDVTVNFPSVVGDLTADGAAHMHVINEVQVADGSSTTYYLANWPDTASVAAYVGGTRQDPTVSGDAVAFASAPALHAKIQFDYIAELT